MENSRLSECDILVIGGGTAGAAAAWAAARTGLRVILAEKTGRLGGTATNGLVSTLCGCYSTRGEMRKISGGARDALAEELKKLGGIDEGVRRDTHRSDICDPELLAVALDRMVSGRGAELLLSAWVSGASFEGERLTSATVANLETGTAMEIKPRVAIDASGRALLAGMAPLGSVLGKGEGAFQAATLVFRMDGVDGEIARGINKARVAELMAEARKKGDITGERDNGVHTVLPCGTAAIVNANWVSGGQDTPAAIAEGLVDGREKVLENARFYRKYVPGFENAVLSVTAPALGVRESARTEGEATLTADDIAQGRVFPDGVCLGSWPMEYHDGETNRLLYRWSDRDYTIPRGCLLPKGMENVLTAGRNISTTREAYASARVMGQCLALGQAAGTAARLALEAKVSLRSLDPAILRKTLEEEGAILE
ncbi:MAG: FAD-dependent oxidoreductase [Aminivibrio sp.]|jgi:hypothetical protein